VRFLGQRYPGLKLHSGRVVNGSLKGFEIKSDRDTLKRLGRQSEIYSKVFDTITLVTSECHLTPALDLIPAWWGIEIAFMDGADEAPRLETWRAELENADVQSEDLVQLLWRDEVLDLLTSRSVPIELKRKPRRFLWQALAGSMSILELKDAVRGHLKRRSSWRADLTIALLRTPMGQQAFKISIHEGKRQEIVDRVAQFRQTAYRASRNNFKMPNHEKGGQ
jgi:hypothetical protein